MKKLFLSIALFCSINCFSQIEYQAINGKNIVKATVKNLIMMCDMSLSQWDSSMIATGYSDKGYANGGNYYSTGLDLSPSVHSVYKYPNGTASIMWSDTKNRDILMGITDELAEWFLRLGENQAAIYGFKVSDGRAYEFSIHKEAGFEYIISKTITMVK